jgi:maltose O-acetyltransferase
MGEQKERMLRGDLYIASDPELVEDHRRCRLLLEAFNATNVMQLDERRNLLGQMLGAIGEDTEIRPPFQCDYGYLICVGHRSFINYGAIILDCARVTIGDEVQFGPGVQILTATHPPTQTLVGTAGSAPSRLRSLTVSGSGVGSSSVPA